MPYTGSLQQIARVSAADTMQLNDFVRFAPAFGVSRAACLLQLTGTGALSCTLRPVFRRRLGDGTFEQYEDASQDKVLTATTAGNAVAWFETIPGLDFGVKVQALTGTGVQAVVLVALEMSAFN